MDSKIRAKYEELLKGPHYEETLIARRKDEEGSYALADKVHLYLQDIGKSIWGQLCLDTGDEDCWPTRIQNYYMGGPSIQLTALANSDDCYGHHVKLTIFNKGKVSGLADLIIEDFPEFEECRRKVFEL